MRHPIRYSARYGSAGANPEYIRAADPDLPSGDLDKDRIPAQFTGGPRLPGVHLLPFTAFSTSASVIQVGPDYAQQKTVLRLYAANYQLRDAPSPAPVVATVPSNLRDGRLFALELRRGTFDYDRGIGASGPPEGLTVHSINQDGSIRYEGVAKLDLSGTMTDWASRRGDFALRFLNVHPDKEFVDVEIRGGGSISFPIRGVLLVGEFRKQRDLNAMTHDDMRNTLIVELTKHSNQTDYQRFDNDTLAGRGAVMVFLRRMGIRDDAALRTMSADDERNTLIVELDAQTGAGQSLQALTNMELVLVGLGSDLATRGQAPGLVSSWIRGVLLLGGFRTQNQLNGMTHDDMRNTLIVELTKHSNQTDYQRFSDSEIEGMGAVMVLMRALGIRDDAALRTMSADDQRNTLIVELDAQTSLGRGLQGLSSLELALTALGVQRATQ